MREFFHGWRRKVACLLLAAALLFLGLWLRSHDVTDQIMIHVSAKHDWLLGSLNNGLFVRLRHSLDSKTVSATLPAKRFEFATHSYEHGWPQDPLDWWSSGCQTISPNYKFCGFRFAKFRECQSASFRFEIWVIPYWSIVLPLTCISAWLLVSRSYPAIPMKTNKSASVEAV